MVLQYFDSAVMCVSHALLHNLISTPHPLTTCLVYLYCIRDRERHVAIQPAGRGVGGGGREQGEGAGGGEEGGSRGRGGGREQGEGAGGGE